MPESKRAPTQTTVPRLSDETVAKLLNLDAAIIHNIIKHAYNCLCEFADDSKVRSNYHKDLALAVIIACAQRWLEGGGKHEITYEEAQANQREATNKLAESD